MIGGSVHVCSDMPAEPRWEQLYASAQRQQERLQQRRALREMEEEQWIKEHSLHQSEAEGAAYDRLYRDAKQRSQRLHAKEQMQLAAEARQLSEACVHGVHGNYSANLASEVAAQRSHYLYEDAKQRLERLAAKRELQATLVKRTAASRHTPAAVGACNMHFSTPPQPTQPTQPTWHSRQPAQDSHCENKQTKHRVDSTDPTAMSRLLLSHATSWRPSQRDR